MLEIQGQSVIFYAHYTTSGVSTTGLTVTIDVYEVTRDGTATQVVTDGACTAVGDGIYRYILSAGSVDAAAEYVGVFYTATDTVDAQNIPALWVIDRANLEDIDDILTDTGTTLPAVLDAIKGVGWTDEDLVAIKAAIDAISAGGATAEEVWEYSSRTLTQSATSITAAVSGSTITDTRGDTWDIDVASLTLDSNQIHFAIKRNGLNTDNEALLLVAKTGGLLRLNGAAVAAGDATKASLTYTGTTLTIAVDASITAQLPVGSWRYSIQSITSATPGVVSEPYGGAFVISSDIVRATA